MRTAVATRQNLRTYSEDFSNAAWTTTGFTVTPDDVANPVDGAITADKITSVSGANVLRYTRTISAADAAGPLCWSIYLKNGTMSAAGWNAGVAVLNITTSTTILATTAMTAGVTGTNTNGVFTITDAGNGWVLVEMVMFKGWKENDSIGFYWGASGGIPAGQYFWAWGAQLTRATHRGPYAPTTSAIVDDGNIRSIAYSTNGVAWSKTSRSAAARRRSVIEMPYALTVNGSTGYSDHGNVYNKLRTDAFSVSGWVKLVDNSVFRFIACKRSNTAPFTGWSFGAYIGGGLAFQMVANSAANHLYAQSSLNTLKLNEWMHVVATYAGTSLVSGVKLYANGLPLTVVSGADTLGSAILTNTDPFRIGAQSAGAAAVWNGGVDRIRMHSRVLTAAEVLDLYNGEVDAAPDGAALMTDGSGPTLTGTGTMPNGTITTPVWTTNTPMHARSAA